MVTLKQSPGFTCALVTIFLVTVNINFCAGASLSASGKNSSRYYGEVLFTGASITEYYRSEGRQTWDQYYEPLQAANVAFAGDGTGRLLDRIFNGLYDPFKARLVVLSDVGSNDIGGGVAENTVIDNYAQILSLIKAHFPGSKIILVALMPRTDRGNEVQQKLKSVNEVLRKFDDGNTIRFFSLEEKLSPGIGSVYDDLYWDDKLHLNARGYVVWAENMASLFNELYNGQ